MGSMRSDRWLPAVIGVMAATVAIVVNYRNGNVAFAAVLLALAVVIGWWSWPRRTGPHLTHTEAQTQAGDDDVIVYWRPG